MKDRADTLYRVMRLVRDRRLNEAVGLLRDYLAGEGKEDVLAFTKLANIYQEQGKFLLAQDTHLTAAKLFIKDGYYSKAVGILKNVVTYAPECLEAYELIYSSFMKLGLEREAIQYSLRVQELKDASDRLAINAEQLLLKKSGEMFFAQIKTLVKKAKAGDVAAKSDLRKIKRMVTSALKRPKVTAKKKSKRVK